MKLEDLTLALRNTSQAKQNLAGLDEDYARAQALRDNRMFDKMDSQGFISPLGIVGDMIANSRGRAMMRDLKPQRAAVRQTIAQNESAPTLYQAKVAANERIRDQKNIDNKAAALKQATKEAQFHDMLMHEQKVKDDKAAAKLLADERAAAGKSLETYIDPDFNQDSIQTGIRTTEGLFHPTTGEKLDVSNQVPYKHAAQQTISLTKSKGKKEVDPMSKVGPPNLVANTITNPYLPDTMGAMNVQGEIGTRTGWSMPWNTDDVGPEVQALGKDLAKIRIDGVKDNLEGLGVNPTDKDLAVAFESMITFRTHPRALVLWTERHYIPALKKAMARAQEKGTLKPEQAKDFLANLEDAVAWGKKQYAPKTPVRPRPVYRRADLEKQKKPVKAPPSFLKEGEQAEYEAWKKSQGM